MSALKQLKEYFTPQSLGEQYDEDNPFVAEEPWQWPDTGDKYGIDSIDDDDVVYDFEWADPGETGDVSICYRERVGAYTRFVIVTKNASTDEDEFDSTAKSIEVIYFNDEQIHGEIREYEYESNGDDEAGSITIDVDTYCSTVDMPRVASDDMFMSVEQLEKMGDYLIEQRISGDN